MLAFFWSAAKAWTRPRYQFYMFGEKTPTVSPAVELQIDNELKMAFFFYHVSGKLHCTDFIHTRCVSRCLRTVVRFLEFHADCLQNFNHLRSLGMKEKPPGIMELNNTCLSAQNRGEKKKKKNYTHT